MSAPTSGEGRAGWSSAGSSPAALPLGSEATPNLLEHVELPLHHPRCFRRTFHAGRAATSRNFGCRQNRLQKWLATGIVQGKPASFNENLKLQPHVTNIHAYSGLCLSLSTVPTP